MACSSGELHAICIQTVIEQIVLARQLANPGIFGCVS